MLTDKERCFNNILWYNIGEFKGVGIHKKCDYFFLEIFMFWTGFLLAVKIMGGVFCEKVFASFSDVGSNGSKYGFC